MATLKKRKGNNYSIRFVKTVDGETIQEQFALGTKKKKTAELWQLRIESAMEKGDIDVFGDFNFKACKKNWNSSSHSSSMDPRLDQLIDKYLKHSTQHNEKTKKNYKSILKRFNDNVGLTMLGSMVKEEDVIDFVFNEDYSISTQNNYLTHIKAFYNWVESKGLSKNPAKTIQKKTEPDNLKDKIITRNELKRVLKKHEEVIAKNLANNSINDDDLTQYWFKPLILFAYCTGLRLGEILNLKWSHISLEDDLINVVSGKGGKSRSVVILKTLKPVLIKWKKKVNEGSSRYVFESVRSKSQLSVRMSNGNVSKTFKKYCRAIDLSESINFHSLRHSFATNRLKDGFDLHMVQKMMGHSTSAITERYIHLVPDDLKERANKLDLI